MDINFEKGTVTLFGKTGKFDTLIKKFTMLSGEQVYHFLINRGIQFSRKMNCYAMMSVLNQRIKFLNSNSLSKDYFQRLQYYTAFGEHQLYNLFLQICNDDDCFYAYRYNLFKLMLSNFVALDFSDGELSYIKNLKKASIESFEQYFNYISGASLEQEDTFDGQDTNILFANLENSASTQEIYDIAGKYGIELPQSLTKDEYYDYIIWELNQNGKYNDELAEGLNEMDIDQLDTFCKRTDVAMSSSLEKHEVVNYFIYLLSKSEMETTSIKRFDITEEYIPLEFSVDLEVLDNEDNTPKKIIHYNGEENDNEEFNQVLIMVNQPQEGEIEQIDEVLETPVEEVKEETAEEALDSILDDVVAEEFVEAVYEDSTPKAEEAPIVDENQAEPIQEVSEENGEAPLEEQEEAPLEDMEEKPQIEEVAEDATVMLNEDLSDVEAASDEEIASLLAKDQEPEEEKDSEPKKDESFKTGVSKNDNYGSDKILKLGTKSLAKTITIAVILGILVAILAYILIVLLI